MELLYRKFIIHPAADFCGGYIDSAQVGPGAECVAGEEGDGLGNHQRGRFANLVRR